MNSNNFSAAEIGRQAKVIGTRISSIKSNLDLISNLVDQVTNLIKSEDSEAARLTASWEGLTEHFQDLSQATENHGNKMQEALEKYADEVKTNETTAATETSEISDSVKSFNEDINDIL